jgi:predicted alpha/beta-fold hydrolase
MATSSTSTGPTARPRDSDRIHAPLLVLFHGLEGSSNSYYAITLMGAAAAIGWSGVVVNFRGCSGESNRLPRAYHSGDSDEIDWILRRLRALSRTAAALRRRRLAGRQCAAQVAGRTRSRCRDCLQAAAAISAPLDLTACGHHLARGFNRVYTRHFPAHPQAQRRRKTAPLPRHLRRTPDAQRQ